MKILLINPPMQPGTEPRFPSFGIAYITQTLRHNGYAVDLLDVDAYRHSNEFVRNVIAESDATVIGIGGLVTVYPYLSWLVPEIRRMKPACTIILGGPGASALKERCFNRFPIDFMVIGEGEITILELLRALTNGGPFQHINGIGFRENGNVRFTERRPLMPTLEHLPLFDDTLFPMERLLRNTHGVFQIHTQRGCPQNCTFCFNAYRVVSRQVRYRPIDQLMIEIKRFKEKYKGQIQLFAISGECVTMNKGWLKEFTQAIMDNQLDIRYRVTSRVDTIDEERLEWLKKSGCVSIAFGLESGSEKILKIMRKNVSAEKGKHAVRIAKKYIPNIEASIMLGYIGEDRGTLRETVEFCKSVGVRPQLFYATAFPGTDLYGMALERKRIVDEEDYLMRLDKRMISDFYLNLTDMNDDEARKAIVSARNEIDNFYFWRDLVRFKIIKYFVHILRTEGMVSVLKRIKRRLHLLLQGVSLGGL